MWLVTSGTSSTRMIRSERSRAPWDTTTPKSAWSTTWTRRLRVLVAAAAFGTATGRGIAASSRAATAPIAPIAGRPGRWPDGAIA